MKSLDLAVLRFFATIVFIASLDSIQIDCASHEVMIKVHPISEWWVSKLLCISQSIKMGPSFVHTCCVCTLIWQLSATSSHGMPPYIVYTNFRMRSAMITFAPKHYLTTHPCHRFFFILWLHRPRLLNAFICKFSQARWRQENLNPDFPHMLHPSNSSLMKSRELYWRHQVAQACV